MDFKITDLKNVIEIGEQKFEFKSQIQPLPIYVYKNRISDADCIRVNINLSEIDIDTIKLELPNSNIVFDNSDFLISEIGDNKVYVVISKRIESDVCGDFINKNNQRKVLDFVFDQGNAIFEIENLTSDSTSEYPQILDIYFVSANFPKDRIIEFIRTEFCI